MHIVHKVTLDETTDGRPALLSHAGLLYLAWKGSGNDNLNVAFSEDDGATFPGSNKATYDDTSDRGPALATFNGGLFIAWKGSGNENLNVATVHLFVGGRGDSLGNKQTLNETTGEDPTLTMMQTGSGHVLALGWKGAGNDNLNVAVSSDGRDFSRKATYPQVSDRGPALADMNIAFKSTLGGAEALTVARIGFVPGTVDRDILIDETDFGDTTDSAPALTSGGDVVVAWKGSGNENLNVKIRRLGEREFSGNPLEETSDLGPALAEHNGSHYLAWKGSGNDNINVARLNI